MMCISCVILLHVANVYYLANRFILRTYLVRNFNIHIWAWSAGPSVQVGRL